MENGSSQKNVRVVVVNGLSRNVVQSHLQTIFGFYGEIVKIDLPLYSKCKLNVRVHVCALYAMDVSAAPFLVPALVHARALHRPIAGVGMNPRDTLTHTAQGGISIAVGLLREVSIVPLVPVLGPPSGGVTVYRPGGGLRAMSVVVPDTVDVAVALEAIQFAQVAHVRSLPPDLGLGLGLGLAPVLHLTLPPRGTVG
ncbi:hypothetical protein ID866_7284, partial [Astraeus odoratus]